MLRRARQAVYWLGIEGDMRHHRDSCDTCNTHAPSQPPSPLLFTPTPVYPFQQTVVDRFQLEGHDYIVYADRLTGWLEISHISEGTASGESNDVLRHHFTIWGAPEQLSVDGSTNLGSEDIKIPPEIGGKCAGVLGAFPAVKRQGRGGGEVSKEDTTWQRRNRWEP